MAAERERDLHWRKIFHVLRQTHRVRAATWRVLFLDKLMRRLGLGTGGARGAPGRLLVRVLHFLHYARGGIVTVVLTQITQSTESGLEYHLAVLESSGAISAREAQRLGVRLHVLGTGLAGLPGATCDCCGQCGRMWCTRIPTCRAC